MLTMEEAAFQDEDGVTYFKRIWRHSSGKEWTTTFKWDDINKAAWLPPCEDLDGALFFCQGF